MNDPVLTGEHQQLADDRARRGALLSFAELNGFLPHGKREGVPHRLKNSWSGLIKSSDSFFGRRKWALGLAALVLFFAGSIALAQPKQSEATLVVSSGSATVLAGRTSLLPVARAESMLSAGEIMAVSANDEISVKAGSTAQLRLFDGSTVDLFENSTLHMRELLTTEDSYRVRLHMLSGKTVSRVIRLLGVGDAFEISTPSSTASVRGTIFTVEMIGPTSTYIACDEGVVQVEMDDRQAKVVAGTEVMAISGQPLDVRPQEDVDPSGPPDAVPGKPPEGDGDPPGPPESVPGSPPEDVPGNPPAAGDEPPGPPDAVPGNPPEGEGELPEKSRDKPTKDVPVGPSEDVPDTPPADGSEPEGGDKANGPPDAVPGKPPDEVPGQGDPPEGGGEPPGQVDKDGGNNGNPNPNGGDKPPKS